MMEYKRIKVIQKNPNPLFKAWLKEWIEDAEKKKKRISKTYQRALDSLNKYPLTLYSGFDCAVLENFGPKICQMLDERLQKHLIDEPSSESKHYKDKLIDLKKAETLKFSDLVRSIEAAYLIDNSSISTQCDVVNEEKGEEREISFQIDLTTSDHENELENLSANKDIEIDDNLLTSSDSEDSFDRLARKYDFESGIKRKQKVKPNNLLKRQKKNNENNVIDLSQCDDLLSINEAAMNSPISSTSKGGTRLKKFKTFDNTRSHLIGPSYTSSPISNFLNVETNNQSPILPASTLQINDSDDEFDKLVNKYNPVSPIPAKKSKVPRSKLTAINEEVRIEPPASNILPTDQNLEDNLEDDFNYISVDDINVLDYNIILLVDIQETSGKQKPSAQDMTSKLRESNVSHHVRKLNVGDFVWIAQHKNDKSKELVLPYIIERKRLDDLSSSIKDGRFHEQKFRLKQCGIENVIYLIENHIKNGKIQCGLPFTTLLQAATNTQIHSNFEVKFTESHQHTILFLTVMTSFIENIFKNKSPMKFKMLEFNAFNQSSVKQRKCTVRETFIKQLLVLKGLSVDIALEITKYYPTPSDLYNKYSSLRKAEGEALLSKITIGELKRKIPITISKTIYHFYTCDKV
ncbi:CLUMA_CG011227, isoform A, partial [Clunio marinus]